MSRDKDMLRDVSEVSTVSEARINKKLDEITADMKELTIAINVLGRMEEVLRQQGEMLKGISMKAEIQAERLREVELSMAKKPDFGDLEERLNHVWEVIRSAEDRITVQENISKKVEGIRATSFSVLKWVAALASALIVVGLTAKDSDARTPPLTKDPYVAIVTNVKQETKHGDNDSRFPN